MKKAGAAALVLLASAIAVAWWLRTPAEDRAEAPAAATVQLDGAPAGRAFVNVDARGFTPLSKKLKIAGSGVTRARFELSAESLVHGRVVDDASGRPIAGAVIMSERSAARSAKSDERATSRSTPPVFDRSRSSLRPPDTRNVWSRSKERTSCVCGAVFASWGACGGAAIRRAG